MPTIFLNQRNYRSFDRETLTIARECLSRLGYREIIEDGYGKNEEIVYEFLNHGRPRIKVQLGQNGKYIDDFARMLEVFAPVSIHLEGKGKVKGRDKKERDSLIDLLKSEAAQRQLATA